MSSAYAAHILSQTQQNIEFLVSQNLISQGDADVILGKLAGASSGGAQSTGVPSVAKAATAMKKFFTPSSSRPAQARALWIYNTDNSDPNDLSFKQGDIIEIVEETNADWWTGKLNGKQGLFPSNYVEKITTPRAVPPAPAPTSVAKTPYKPFKAALHGNDTPPPAQVDPTNSVGLQQAPGQDQKKARFGQLGDRMANSAASGVGFGAGAAIGGGLVRAIF